MRILLAGYQGQENLGDDLTDLLTICSLAHEFGDIELSLLNFGSAPRPGRSVIGLIEDIISCHPATRRHVRRLETVWFDTLDQTRFDLVVINNSSMYGAGKTNFEIGAIAQGMGIPTRYLCLKEYLAEGFYGGFQRSVLAGAHCAIFRDADHAKSLGQEFLSQRANVVIGCDMALFTATLFPRQEPHGACLLFPRWGADPSNAATVACINSLLDRNREQHFMLVAGSFQDEGFFRSFWHRRNMSILSIAHTALDEICRVIAGGKKAIAFGRHHGVVVATAYGLPAAYIAVGTGEDRTRKIVNFAAEFGIPYLASAPSDIDTFVRESDFPSGLPANSAIRHRIRTTLDYLPGLAAPSWLKDDGRAELAAPNL